MSKFHLLCSCTICKIECTVQSIKSHFNKHHTNKCKWCDRFTSNAKFCSNSCAAQFNNRCRESLPKPEPFNRFALTLQRYEAGEVSERSTLRKCLSHTIGYACAICSVSQWVDQPITLIVDHIDGNAGNNSPSNLRLLCPNCNSQTPTFGGRNKGNGRKARGIALH